MASIRNVGEAQWQVQIRRKGITVPSRTFETHFAQAELDRPFKR
jgi:hypothetical protein